MNQGLGGGGLGGGGGFGGGGGLGGGGMMKGQSGGTPSFGGAFVILQAQCRSRACSDDEGTSRVFAQASEEEAS